MRWLLDTNICIHFLNGRGPNVRDRIAQADPAELAVCSVVKAEIYYGALRSRDPVRAAALQESFLSAFASFAFDDRCARQAGDIRAILASAGTPIGPHDLLIAAIAIANGLTLVTANVGEFSRVPGLSWVDWSRDR